MKEKILQNNENSCFMFFLCLNLTHCFLIPRLKINRALHKENCQKLGNDFLYDLSSEDLKKSFALCLEKGFFKEALKLLNHQKKEVDSFIFLEKRAFIYTKLDQIDSAIEDYKALLKAQPQNKNFYKYLIELYIKKNDFEKSLKTINNLLNLNLSSQDSLEFRFVQARLFLLLYQKDRARQAFLSIQKQNPNFFKMKKGSIYLALLSEQEQNFLEAIEELKQADWKGVEGKIQHWESRQLNKP